QRHDLSAERLQGQLDFWRDRLRGAPECLVLPNDHPRPARPSHRGSSLAFRLDADLTARLERHTREAGGTLFMTLLSSWAALLSRTSGASDLVIGSPVAGRSRSETEDLIGFFVNLLALRVDLSGAPSFEELVAQVRHTCLEAYANQDLPFESLIELLAEDGNQPRNLSHAPLFQVMLALQDQAYEPLALAELEITPRDGESTVAKFDLTLVVRNASQGVSGKGIASDGTLSMGLEYATDLFEPGTIERMSRHFEQLLRSALDEPQQALTRLDILPPAERRQLLVEWNATAVELPQILVHELIEAQAAGAPDALALRFEDQSLTYGALNARANQLAHLLVTRGVRPSAPDTAVVGIALEPSLEMIVAVLGVWKAGGAYVPLDPSYPAQRLAFMLEDCETRILITRKDLDSRLPQSAVLHDQVATLDPHAEAIASQPRSNPQRPILPRHLAYVIYTSGSTGRPKGVALEHRGLSNLAGDHLRTFGLSPDSRILKFASFSFDASIVEIVMALCSGASLHIPNAEERPPGEPLQRYVEETRITFLVLSPTALAALTPGESVRFEHMIVAGEACAPALAATWAPGRRLFNGYGPTEATVCASIAECAPEGLADERSLPIGRPLRNVRLYCLGRDLVPTPLGTPGELYVSGASLARGYLHRPALTAEKFIADPFSDAPGRRLYKTGDLVRYRADANLEFLGRIDHQVKIRGFRVELGEIEAAITALPQVREALVAARGEGAEKQLAAYVVLHSQAEDAPGSTELRAALGAHLLDHMVPTLWAFLPSFPLTPAGKVDRAALEREAAFDDASGESSKEAPRNALEEILTGQWATLLKADEVGIHDNFFELGGHSLLATQLISRIRASFGIQLPVRALFEHPTIAGLAHRLEAGLRETSSPLEEATVVHERPDPVPLSWAQYRLWFLDRFEDGAASSLNIPIALRWRGALEPDALRAAFQQLLTRHEVLRTSFPVLDDGEPIQRIAPRLTAGTSGIDIPIIDLCRLDAGDRESQSQYLQLEHGRRPFDLLQAPLLRVALLRLEAQDHILLQCVHHIVSDGWSVSLMLREVFAAYLARVRGQELALPTLPLQYADHAVAQRQRLAGDAGQAELDWWREVLQAPPPALDLPTDFSRPPIASHRGGQQAHRIDAELADELRRLARERSSTLFMVLLAAFKVVLARLSGTRDILMGTPIAGRQRGEVEDLVGCFLNTLVLRTDLGSRSHQPGIHVRFEDVLDRVRDGALGAYAHQELPFERILEDLAPERDLSRTPLFQIFFNMLNLPPVAGRELLDGADFEIAALDPLEAESKFDLTVYLSEQEDGAIALNLVYRRDLFLDERIAELARQFERVLRRVADDPSVPIDELSLLSEPARRAVGDLPSVQSDAFLGTVPELFLHRAAEHPERLALCDPHASLSYAQAARDSAELARRLRRLGVDRGDVVTVLARRNAALGVAVLGVLRAGAVVSILDPDVPAARLDAIVQSAQPSVMLEVPSKVMATNPGGVFALRQLAPAEPCRAPIDLPLDADDPAILTFTSGSTGKPKGVLGRHGPLTHFLSWQAERFGHGRHDRVSVLSGLSHDPLQRDLFTPLCLGAAAVFPDPEQRLEPGYLAGWMARQRISLSHLTPALGQVITEHAQDAMPALSCVFLVGEALTRRDVEALQTLAPRAQIVNLYGSTETQRAVSFHLATRVAPTQPEILPLGRGMRGVDLLVLNPAGGLAGIGELGEIHVRSPHLAVGYPKDSALTGQRFIPCRLALEPGERVYRTGDLGRYLPNGEVAFAGRTDLQVQVRGFRIEPGEIEAVLARHPGVERVAVLARGSQLTACLTQSEHSYASRGSRPETAASALAQELRAWLSERLPDYMVPSAFHILDVLPLTPTAKVDRRALLELASQALPEGSSSESPQGATEQRLAAIWSDVLGAPRVGRNDNFFALGGHSLLATRLVARLRSDLGVEISLRQLFSSASLADLAKEIEPQISEGSAQDEPLLERPEILPLSWAQRRLWFLDRFEDGEASNLNMPSAIRWRGALEPAILRAAFNSLVARHEVLRTSFPTRDDGQPMQRIAAQSEIALPVIDLSRLRIADRDAEARACQLENQRHTFDLLRAPLLRVSLLRLEPRHHVLLQCVHHIVCDGWSLGLISREVLTTYLARALGQQPSHPELTYQYADHTLAQLRRLEGDAGRTELRWWREALKTPRAMLELPTDARRPAVASSRGEQWLHVLDAELSQALRALTHRQGTGQHRASLFMVLLAAFKIVLARLSGERDILVGTPIAGRRYAEVENLVGCFLNTLVLRTDLGPVPDPVPDPDGPRHHDASFDDILARVCDNALGAFAHQEIPFER
ncbi:MAG: amino acid adenylation domain-containing protein, partial [Acidobacteriota bacterium]